MTEFDATSGALISKKIGDQTNRSRFGRIIEVFEHLRDEDKSNFEVDVELLDSQDKQHRAIPWQNPQSGEIKIPKVGDKVVVDYVGSSKKFPVARNAIYTSARRPPKGRAGMWRKEIESGETPAGKGNLYVESYTSYDTDAGSPAFDKEAANPMRSYIRLAKKEKDTDTSIVDHDFPISVEIYDDPDQNESFVEVTMNPHHHLTEQEVENQFNDDQKGTMTFRFDAAAGTMEMTGLPSGDSQDSNIEKSKLQNGGIKYWLKDGSFKLLDGYGFGIVSNGQGKFQRHEQSSTTVAEKTDFTTSGYDDIGPT